MKILVVEDEKELNRAMGDALKRSNYDYDWAETGNNAWEYLTKNSYDLILLDIMVPHGNGTRIPHTITRMEIGLYILRNLRAGTFDRKGTQKNVPVVVSTAITNAGNIDEIKCLLENTGAFYQKPKKPSIIVDKISEILGQ